MYTIDELNVRLLSELKEIAEELDISNYKKLSKKDLIYKILDQQAVTPDVKNNKKKPKPSRIKRENVAVETEQTADELLESFKIEMDESITSFDLEPVVEAIEPADEEISDHKVEKKVSDSPDKPDAHKSKEYREKREPREPEQREKKGVSIKEFDGAIENEGVLEIMQDGYVYLRSTD